ncbi:MAG: DUF1896 family protein [Rikenellaceae bacterium]
MKQQNTELSYYELSLIAFLRESHPELSNSRRLIKSRSEAASTAYEEAFRDGNNTQECIDIANRTLYKGLHFSKYDTILNILWTEFSADIHVDIVPEVALELTKSLKELFNQYELTDDFAYSADYQTLYTELVGAIQLKLEEYGKL